MGSLYSTPTVSHQKPASVMPLVGCGAYSETGCADLMISYNSGGSSEKGECSPEDEGVFARIFYPTRLKSAGEEKENLDPSQVPETVHPVEYPMWRPRREYLDGLADYRNSNPFYIHFFFDWILGERRACAGWQQPLASGDGKFPVVVFSHGISGHRSCYSTYCASLASYGFIVAAIEHRDRSASWSYYLKESSPGTEGTKMVECPVLITTFPEGEKEFRPRNRQLHIRVKECINTLKVLDQINTGLETNNNNTPEMRVVYGEEFDWSQFKVRVVTRLGPLPIKANRSFLFLGAPRHG